MNKLGSHLLKTPLTQMVLVLAVLCIGGAILALVLGSIRFLIETLFYGSLLLGGAYFFLGGRSRRG